MGGSRRIGQGGTASEFWHLEGGQGPHLLFCRVQVLAPERVDAIREALFYQVVVHAHAAEICDELVERI